MNTKPKPFVISERERYFRPLIGVFIVSAFTLVILGIVAWWYGHSVFFGIRHPALTEAEINPLNDMGNFGSYLQGTTASLWSLAAFFVILVAFLAQKQQIIRQEVEIAEQREEFDLQQKSIKKQDFESFFFHLLNLHNQNVSQMRGRNNHQQIEGRACFKIWFEHLHDGYTNRQDRHDKTNAVKMEILAAQYEGWFRYNQAELAHYFRTLFHLIKFVKFSDVIVEFNEKKRYTSLVRAQLSAYELALLFYNGLSVYGANFKPWIEEFSLLEHLDTDKFLLEKFHEDLYDARAYDKPNTNNQVSSSPNQPSAGGAASL